MSISMDHIGWVPYEIATLALIYGGYTKKLKITFMVERGTGNH